MPEEPDPQLEVVHLRALVRRVDQAHCELRVHGTHRKETVCDGVECVSQPVTIREAGYEDRRSPRAGLDLRDELGDRVPQGSPNRRTGPAMRFQPLELIAVL